MSLRARLEAEVGAVPLRDMAPHHLRGALFVVAPPLALVEVALAVAEDRTEAVRGWLDAGALRRFEEADLGAWSGVDRHRVLVVQPYVLVEAPAVD